MKFTTEQWAIMCVAAIPGTYVHMWLLHTVAVIPGYVMLRLTGVLTTERVDELVRGGF